MSASKTSFLVIFSHCLYYCLYKPLPPVPCVSPFGRGPLDIFRSFWQFPVMNWHFSRSFHFIFLSTYGHYPSGLVLSTLPHLFQTISPTHFVHRYQENTCIETHYVADTTFILQRATRFKPRRNTSSIV